ncbi:glycosyltransferase [Dactylosporangium vinaceum]
MLFLPWSQPTHYMPMVPLAWALRAAGHDVRVAAQEHTAEAVRRSGLTVRTIGAGYDYLEGFQRLHEEALRHQRENPGRAKTLDQRGDMPPEQRRKLMEARSAPFVKTAEAMAPDLVALVEDWRPDLVIANPFAMAAPVAATVAKAPLITHLTGPAFERKMGLFPMSGATPDVWPGDLRRLYDEHGVEPVAELADAVVDPCPQSLQFPGIPNRRPIRFVPYNGPGPAPAWIDAPATRRVCLTWGTTTTGLAGTDGFLVPRILSALEAVDDLEIVVAVTAADRALLPGLPQRVRVVEGLPLHLLLPSCSLVIHQGGSGTALTAAACGVPQLMVAGMPDQVVTANMVVKAGAGVSLESVDAIAEATRAVLGDAALRSGARDLRAEIDRQPTPAEVATEIAR